MVVIMQLGSEAANLSFPPFNPHDVSDRQFSGILANVFRQLMEQHHDQSARSLRKNCLMLQILKTYLADKHNSIGTSMTDAQKAAEK